MSLEKPILWQARKKMKPTKNLSRRWQRDTRRVMILLLTICFISHVYMIADSTSSHNGLAQQDEPNRGWRGFATEMARMLLPISNSKSVPNSEEPDAEQIDVILDHVKFEQTDLPLDVVKAEQMDLPLEVVKDEQMNLTLDQVKDEQTNSTSDQVKDERMNATFVSLARNSELAELLSSIRHVENHFNQNWHYDWVFLNDDDFTEEFKAATTAATSGRARYGKVDAEHWSFPDFIDTQRAERTREEMKDVKYGDSVSYRHMCRYQSGFFYRHPLVLEYDWYWRVEPSIELFCDIPYDPFRWMAENGKKYSFVIAPNELKETVPSLWGHVRQFMEAYPQHINADNHLHFLSEDGGQTSNYCHFWSNFEIASLDFYRSEAYNEFFNYLDRAGGFFYERWGDASVHSIAAALMLKKGEIHFFDDIGYRHSPWTNCPRNPQIRQNQNCRCNVEDNMDWNPSCTKRFFEVTGIPFPESYDRDVPLESGILQ